MPNSRKNVFRACGVQMALGFAWILATTWGYKWPPPTTTQSSLLKGQNQRMPQTNDMFNIMEERKENTLKYTRKLKLKSY